MDKITLVTPVDTFVAFDGRPFSRESDCIEWEKRLNESRIYKEIVHREIKLDENIFPYSDWMLVSNQEQLDYFMAKYITSYHCVNFNSKNKLSIGDWVCIVYERDDDNYREESGLVTLEYVLRTCQDAYNLIQEETVNGKY